MARGKIVFFGNCQAYALSLVYTQQIAPLTEQTVVHVNANAGDSEAAAIEEISNADIVVVQETDLPTKIRLGDLKSGTRRISYPSIVGGFYWPFGGRPHVKHEESTLWESPYAAEHGDGFLNRLITNRLAPEEGITRYLDLDVRKIASLDRLLELSIDRQKSRDAKTGIRVAEIIESHYCDEYLFMTPGHPNLTIFKILATQLYCIMGIDESVVSLALGALYTSPFPQWKLPIHPKVIEHFGLKFVDNEDRYLHMEGSFSFVEYARRYLRYDWSRDLRAGIKRNAIGGEPGECLDLLERGLREAPHSGVGYHHKALVLSKLGRFVEARESIERAIILGPPNPDIHADLAQILLKMSDLPGAEHAALNALSIFPNSVSARRALAEVAAKLGNLPLALDSAKQVAKLAPSDAHDVANIGRYALQEGDLTAAESAFRKAIAMKPGVLGFHDSLADVLDRQGRGDEALAMIKLLIEAGALDAYIYARFGRLLTKRGDLTNAEPAFLKAIAMKPEVLGFHDSLADVLDRQGRGDEALAVLRHIVEVGTNDAHTYARFGRLSAKQGDVKTAELALRKAIELDPFRIGFQFALADILGEQQKIDQAINVLCAIVSVQGMESQISDRLEQLRARRGEHSSEVRNA